MGTITDIQRFSIHDGPGIRTTVFFKGCPLRCRWCHNPETNEPIPQIRLTAHKCVGCGACAAVCPAGCHIQEEGKHVFDAAACTHCRQCLAACPMLAISVCGEEVSAEEVVDEAMRDVAFYGSVGGITLSGGEPMMQAAFAAEILRLAKARGLNTGIETCGQFDPKYLPVITDLCDNIYWDVKMPDDAMHRTYTGVSNKLILQNLCEAAKKRPDIVTRTVITAGLTDTEEHVRAVCRIAMENHLTHPPVLLAFHPYGSSKGDEVGDRGRVKMGEEYIPEESTMERLRQAVDAFWKERR